MAKWGELERALKATLRDLNFNWIHYWSLSKGVTNDKRFEEVICTSYIQRVGNLLLVWVDKGLDWAIEISNLSMHKNLLGWDAF